MRPEYLYDITYYITMSYSMKLIARQEAKKTWGFGVVWIGTRSLSENPLTRLVYYVA